MTTSRHVFATLAYDQQPARVDHAADGVSLLHPVDDTRAEVFSQVEGWLGVSRLKMATPREQAPRQYRDVMHRHRL